MEYSHPEQPSLIQSIMMLQRKDMLESAHGFCVVYSVTDRSSFHQAELYLQQLATEGTVDRRAVILVANKVDLARSRVVSEQGMLVRELSTHTLTLSLSYVVLNKSRYLKIICSVRPSQSSLCHCPVKQYQWHMRSQRHASSISWYYIWYWHL